MQYMYCLRRGNLVGAEGFPALFGDIADLTYLSQSQRDHIRSTWEDVTSKTRNESKPRFQNWAAKKSNKCVWGTVVYKSNDKFDLGTWVACENCRKRSRPCIKRQVKDGPVFVLPGKPDAKDGEEFDYF